MAGFFAVSLVTSRGEAARRRDECRAIVDAEEAADRGEHEEAARMYTLALDRNEESPIRSHIERWHGQELVAAADEVRDAAFSRGSGAQLLEAARMYEAVMEDFKGSWQANLASASLDELWQRVERVSRLNPCAGTVFLTSLREDYYYVWARNDLPLTLSRCAREHFIAGRYGQAASHYRRIVDEFPNGRLAATARRGLIAAQVAAVRGGRAGRLPDPVISGSSGSGRVEISIRNSSPYPLELLLSGPDAKRLEVPACRGCRKYSRGNEPSSCPPGPRRTMTISGGRYSAVVRSTTAHDVEAWVGDWTLTDGYSYGHCFYVVTSSD
ncbi:MAG TPA: hypothetical protein VNJ46_09750 [Gaiellaceae bacterium]|nr:hypothetical protein [Gaiellaceae bacterium]